LKAGRDALLLSTGGMLADVWAAAADLKKQGYSVAVWSCPFLKPLDVDSLVEAARTFPLILTIEEAQLGGGLGGAVAEIHLPVPRALSCSWVTGVIMGAFSQMPSKPISVLMQGFVRLW
jgi:transketolase C-terminal domain/subunit